MPKTDRFLQLQTLVQHAVVRLEEVKRRDIRSSVALSIYCSILEKSQCILTLINEQLGHHAISIIREQFELLVDLRNLNANEDYLKYLEYQQDVSERKALVAMKAITEYDHLHYEIDEKLRVIGRRVEASKHQFDKTTIGARAKRVGLKKHYEVLYPRLSQHSHSSLLALSDRHIVDGRIHCFAEVEQSTHDPVLELSIDILQCATEDVHEMHRGFAG